jgi:hypothetical protein
MSVVDAKNNATELFQDLSRIGRLQVAIPYSVAD